MMLHKDCRHYKSYKPCNPHKMYDVECEGCPYYAKIAERILIINLEAIGDVIRTTALLPAFKKKYPDSHITWLTSARSSEALKGITEIDHILIYDFDAALRLEAEEFDILVNLEKAEGVSALATQIKAKQKAGFGLLSIGQLFAFNKESDYLL